VSPPTCVGAVLWFCAVALLVHEDIHPPVRAESGCPHPLALVLCFGFALWLLLVHEETEKGSNAQDT